MPTSTFRRLLMALIIGSGLWLGSAGAAAGTSPTSVAPPTTASTSVAPTSPRPDNPDDGFQAEDVREFVEDNTVPIIIVVGLVLLVALWKFVSRPANTKF